MNREDFRNARSSFRRTVATSGLVGLAAVSGLLSASALSVYEHDNSTNALNLAVYAGAATGVFALAAAGLTIYSFMRDSKHFREHSGEEQ